MLEKFSTEPNIPSSSPIEAINTKKSPFFKLDKDKYLLLDVPFLVDKCYHSFVYDVWFDKIRPGVDLNKSNDEKIKEYMGVIGNFFEEHVGKIFQNSFSDWTSPPVKVLDDLKVQTSEGEVELADVYLRHFKKVLIGQVKVSAINSKEKYTIDDASVFRLDREKFYKTFGLNQLVEMSLLRLVENPLLFDEQFPDNKRVKVFPILLVNERYLQSPTINIAFQKRFLELLKKNFEKVIIPENYFGDAVIANRYVIKPVVVCYIADFEILSLYLSSNPSEFGNIIQNHMSV